MYIGIIATLRDNFIRIGFIGHLLHTKKYTYIKMTTRGQKRLRDYLINEEGNEYRENIEYFEDNTNLESATNEN